jgi:archaellum component FlaC
VDHGKININRNIADSVKHLERLTSEVKTLTKQLEDALLGKSGISAEEITVGTITNVTTPGTKQDLEDITKRLELVKSILKTLTQEMKPTQILSASISDAHISSSGAGIGGRI